jgi:bifunctional UDP-N-acetylglucosamine pyrophosphorylase / glucosamine-1-phosphate N-acetyltransferase
MPQLRAAVILAAGHGTRMKTRLPKVLHPLGGRTMFSWAVALAHDVHAALICAVVSSKTGAVGKAAASALGGGAVVVQDPPRGTGDAVRCAGHVLDGFEGDVVTLYADTPLITAATIERVFEGLQSDAAIVVLGFDAAEPGAYGRLILGEDGTLDAIVEAKDASDAQKTVTLCNSGVMAVSAELLFSLLQDITNDNANGEYYLTDIVGLARARGLKVVVVQASEQEVMGVNSQAELALAESVFQDRKRAQWLADGIRMAAPQTVHASWDTRLEPDCVIDPYVVFGPGVHLGAGTHVRSFSHLEGATSEEAVSIGPFTRLRQGTHISAHAKIGNFVETKKANIGDGAKISHLSYIGDAIIGANVNIGAGTITCNYDGFDKHVTVIKSGAFIGSNTALVAPVSVGAGAVIGSGSVITRDVGDDALAVGRGRQRDIEGWAESFRARKKRT